jgi:tRNA-splicing ligase RtcB
MNRGNSFIHHIENISYHWPKKDMKQTKIYAEHLDPETLQQFNSAMEQEFSIQGALMPDAHKGYSLPIGGVIATDGVVLPSWVGYDIGCGMCAVPTFFDAKRVKKHASSIFFDIYKSIPIGFNVNKQPLDSKLNPSDLTYAGRKTFHERKGFRALGTLGSGNHFIEIGLDPESNIWIIIHSGSRGIGHGIATNYMKLASGSDKPKEGHFGLSTDSEAGQAYINDMNWALAFALENRKKMMKRVVAAIKQYSDGDANWNQLINKNHNHAEEHNGLWIHRKGATHAEKDMLGVIPGNMRDGSFIVSGKGHPDSLQSSSHGAGRILGRNQAKRTLKIHNFKEIMQGITAKVSKATLDESPMAYKDIFDVMHLQKDLVDVICHVLPIINVKG